MLIANVTLFVLILVLMTVAPLIPDMIVSRLRRDESPGGPAREARSSG